METFVENILKGVRQWVNTKFDEVTLAEPVSDEIIKMLWDGDIKMSDLKQTTGSSDFVPVGSQTNLEHFIDIFYPNPEEIFVDLGLSVKWHAVNLGAHAITDYGNYYAWGETETKSDYSWSTYKHANGASNKLTKYCPTNKTSLWDGTGSPDNKLVLDVVDDVVNLELGGNYRMPTKEEIEELIALPNKWMTINGVNGRAFCKANEPGAIKGDFSIIETGLYLYDENQPNPNNEYGSYNIYDYFEPIGLEYQTKEEVNAKLTTYYAENYGWKGTVNVDTMLFKDQEHTTPAVAGTDYMFGSFPVFNPISMLFIPAAGYFDGSTHSNAGSSCRLWTSSLNSDNPISALRLSFDSGGIYLSSNYRYYGFPVRCVSTD